MCNCGALVTENRINNEMYKFVINKIDFGILGSDH